MLPVLPFFFYLFQLECPRLPYVNRAHACACHVGCAAFALCFVAFFRFRFAASDRAVHFAATDYAIIRSVPVFRTNDGL